MVDVNEVNEVNDVNHLNYKLRRQSEPGRETLEASKQAKKESPTLERRATPIRFKVLEKHRFLNN